jgi:integrase
MSKEKVHLREKVLAKGKIGLYLDYSIKGKRKQETINGLQKFAKPKNKTERDHNKATENKAREIRNNREQDILANYFGETINYKPKTLFVEFCEMIAQSKNDKTSTQSVWMSMIYQLKKFDRNARLMDLSEEWQESLKTHLLKNVKQNSAHSYNNKVRTAIKEAVTRKYINDIRLVKGIPYKEVRREYLTESEIKILIKTKCDNQRMKEAFIFCCFTGLRNKDVRQLTWNDIKINEKNTFIYYEQSKTSSLENIPINNVAIKMLGKKGEPTELVFKNVKCNAENNNKLAIWILRAGITKKITFHCSRHSYAVLLLENKTDIYSVAKMLGHKDMKSTLIYLKFTDELKLKAMNSLPNFNL